MTTITGGVPAPLHAPSAGPGKCPDEHAATPAESPPGQAPLQTEALTCARSRATSFRRPDVWTSVFKKLQNSGKFRPKPHAGIGGKDAFRFHEHAFSFGGATQFPMLNEGTAALAIKKNRR